MDYTLIIFRKCHILFLAQRYRMLSSILEVEGSSLIGDIDEIRSSLEQNDKKILYFNKLILFCLVICICDKMYYFTIII